MLLERIRTELIEAQKARDALKTETLRGLIAAIRYMAIDKYGGKEDQATDEDILAVIKKQVKQHQESIEAFKNANRSELVEKETAELTILQVYLPPELPDEDIENVVKEIIASGATNFGQIMGQTMSKLKGQVSGDRVSAVVKKVTE